MAFKVPAAVPSQSRIFTSESDHFFGNFLVSRTV